MFRKSLKTLLVALNDLKFCEKMENQQLSQNPAPKPAFRFWVVWIVITVIIVIGIIVSLIISRMTDSGYVNSPAPTSSSGSEDLSSQLDKARSQSILNKSATWTDQSVVIPGTYADADVVKLADGRYRLYYAVEPEVAGNNLEVYSSISTDGVSWTKEEGIRKTMATFPDALKLADGTLRLYFQNPCFI